MGSALVTFLTFGAIFMAVFALNSLLIDLFQRDAKRIERRISEEFRMRQRERARAAPLFKDLSQVATDAFAEQEKPPSRTEQFLLAIEQSGLALTAPRLLALAAVSGSFLGLIFWLLSGSALAGCALFLVGASFPILYMYHKRSRRLEKLRSQLPDAYELMSRVLRAGQTMSQAMQTVADDFSAPIAVEFAYCYEQQNLGLSPELALRDLARRTGLLEVKIFVLAMMVHRQTGGNLAELLDKLSAVVRDRYRIQGMIKSLTAEGRLQAGVLLALSPAIFAVMILINPTYSLALFDYPLLLIGCGVSMLLGALWIRKIITFDF